MKTLLTRWLKVYEDEISLFVWMTLLFFFIRSSNIVLNNFVETAFLKRYGVEYLPMVTAVNAVITFIVLTLLAGVIARVRGDRMMARTLLVCGLITALVRPLMPLGYDLLYPLLYVLKTQFDAIQVLLYWNLGNDLFSTRQSKRLFPLITVGGIVGGIAGSFGTPLLARLIAPDNLLLFFSALSAGGALVAWKLGQSAPSSAMKEPAAPGKGGHSMVEELRRVVPLLKSSTLAVVLLMLTLLPNIITPIMNYQFSYAVDAAYASESGMLGFFSYFRGAQNVISLLLSLFVGRIYGRFGLPVALMFHPLNFLLVFGGFLFSFGTLTAIYAGLSVNVIRTTINIPSTSALYGLLLPRDRAVLRPFLRGTVVRIGVLAGSAILWLSVEAMHPRYLSLIAFGFVAAWIFTTLIFKRRYAGILVDLLRTVLPNFYQFDRAERSDLLRGVAATPVLLERLRSAEGDDAVTCAELLRDSDPAALDAAILARLPAADDATRIKLLPYLSEQTGAQAIEVFKPLVDPASPELMVALARTLRRVYADLPEKLEHKIFTTLSNPEAQACFLGWMRDRPAERDALVAGWLASAEPAELRAGTLAAGEYGLHAQLPTLQRLLASTTDPTLLSLLLRELHRLAAPALTNLAKPFLSHPDEDVRQAAIAALDPDSSEAVQALMTALGDPADPVRKLAIDRLAKTPPELQAILIYPGRLQSRRVRDGLFRVARELGIKEVTIVAYYRAQLEAAYTAVACTVWLDELAESPARELLLQHLEELRRLRVGNVVHGLASRDASGRMALVFRGLQNPGSREYADSIEALDTLLDRSLSGLILPMLENQDRADRLAVARRQFDLNLNGPQAIDRLLQDQSWVTVLLTLEVLDGTALVEALRSTITQLAQEGPAMVAETAGRLVQQPAPLARSSVDLAERINQLRRVSLLSGLPVRDLAELATVAVERRLATDAPVVDGDGPGLQLVIAGAIVAEQEHPAGGSELTRFGPGQSFGEMTLVGARPAGVRLRALEPSVLLGIDREAFDRITLDWPDILLQIGRVLSERLVGLADRLVEQKATAASAGTSDDDAIVGDLSDLHERLLQLRRTTLFQGLGVSELAAVASIALEVELGGDERLVDGEADKGLYLVVSGEVVFESGSTSRQLLRLGPGDVFGLTTLFNVAPREDAVRATRTTRLLHIAPDEFRAIVLDHPGIARQMCRILSERLASGLDILGRLTHQ